MKQIAAALALVGALVACAQAGQPGYVVAAPAKVNGSGIVVSYRIVGEPKVGLATTISLSFGGVVDPAGAQVRFASDGGLALGSGTPTVLDLTRGGPSTIDVVVTPMSLGRFYLNVFTAQHGARSAVSVPVQVGERRAVEPYASPGEDEPVIVMPAE